MELFNKIKTNYKRIFNIKDDNYLDKLSKNSISLSLMIAFYAHKDQKRNNNEDYIIHPLNILKEYRDLIHIDKINNDNNEDILKILTKSNIPYKGIEELIILHDVIEDTSITSLDLYNIFKINDLGEYFNEYIKEPLLLLTHNKKEDYSIYINKVLKNKEASLVKLLDMYDNLNLLTVGMLNEDTIKDKLSSYLKYSFKINEYYHFSECFYKYNEYLNSLNK